jgi:hypothetical protein
MRAQASTARARRQWTKPLHHSRSTGKTDEILQPRTNTARGTRNRTECARPRAQDRRNGRRAGNLQRLWNRSRCCARGRAHSAESARPAPRHPSSIFDNPSRMAESLNLANPLPPLVFIRTPMMKVRAFSTKTLDGVPLLYSFSPFLPCGPTGETHCPTLVAAPPRWVHSWLLCSPRKFPHFSCDVCRQTEESLIDALSAEEVARDGL